LSFQRRKIVFDHIPDRIPVDSEVVVDEDVSHPDDIRPWDAGICGSELRRDPPYGFPDDLEWIARTCAISSL